ncbi:unnamed protein product [Candidula unifasciata]|uniref:G-protein coupled receptors family 1 profile domain-containing protein n=1 Tax=Candidula unifasciata TaxID=100452 RepID=A0A8S3ZEX0_9EUPU|nr:unnamed protein product [Candidula unifasciata]
MPVMTRRQPSFLSLVYSSINESVMPVVLSVGILGNLLLVFTFMLTPLRASALCHYLTAVAVSDFIYLLSSLAVWITSRGINLQNTMGVCQITMFSLMLFGFLKTWYLFAAHAERLVVHFGSTRALKWCTTFRTKCIIIAIFVFSLVGYSHHMWIYIVIEWNGISSCLLMPESRKHMAELGKVEVIFALFLPMLLIVMIDFALFVRMAIKGSKHFFRPDNCHKTKDFSQSPSTRSGDSIPPPPEFDISRERTRATVLVVVTGLIFLGIILPSSIYRAKQYFKSLAMPSLKDRDIMMLAELIVNFNSVYKIFLYPMILKSFRRGLIYFFRHGFCEKKIEEPHQETSV